MLQKQGFFSTLFLYRTQVIYSTMRFIFKHSFIFFNFSLEKCLTPHLIHPNIRPPLKRPYRLEA